MPTLTITKTYVTGAVLTETDLDNIKSSIETFINTTKLDNSNIQVDVVGTSMTSTGANAIASTMTSTGSNAIAASMNSTGTNSLITTMSAAGADLILNNADGSHTMAAAAANQILNRATRTFSSISAGSTGALVTSGNVSPSSATVGTSFVDVSCSITLLLSGNKLVNLALIPADNSGGFSSSSIGVLSISNGFVDIQFRRSASNVVYSSGSGITSGTITQSLSAFRGIDIGVTSAGTYIYSVYMRCDSGTIWSTKPQLAFRGWESP